jgi:hypothetical protein
MVKAKEKKKRKGRKLKKEDKKNYLEQFLCIRRRNEELKLPFLSS